MARLGGNDAAFGFRYQYLITLERALRLRIIHRGAPETWSMRIDPPHDDAIDLQIRQVTDGTTTVEVIQIKGSHHPGTQDLTLPAARRIFERLALSSADRSTIHTNRALTRLDAAWIQVQEAGTAMAPGIRIYVPNDPEYPAWTHIGSPRNVLQDTRDIDRLSQDVVEMVGHIRADQGLTTGRQSVGALVSVLLDDIFRRATTPTEAELTAAQFEELLRMKGADLFRAVGLIDTGLLLGTCPGHPVVERSRTSRSLDDLLSPRRAPGRVNGASVLGLSGLGKTSAVLAWVRARRHLVDFVVWLDATGGERMLEASIRIALHDLGPEDWRESPADVLREFLQTTPMHWVLVVDNVDAGLDVAAYVPRGGHGHVILIASARTGTTQMFPEVLLQPLDDDQEIKRYVAAALGEDSAAWDDTERSAALTLSAALGGFPIALTVACHELRLLSVPLKDWGRYLEHLETISLENLPDGPDRYPRTALQAVASAVQRAVADRRGDQRLAKRFLLSVEHLGGQDVPAGLAWAAVAESWGDDLSPAPSLDPDVLIRADISSRKLVGILSDYGLIHQVGHQLDGTSSWHRALSLRLSLHPVILRAISPALVPMDSDLNDVAYNTDALLSAFLGRSMEAVDGVSIDLLATVTQSVARGITEGKLPTTRAGLLLLGNTARLHRRQERFDEAERLLSVEKAWLFGLAHAMGTRLPWKPWRLLVKINTDLLMVRAEGSRIFSDTDRRLVEEILDLMRLMPTEIAPLQGEDGLALPLMDALTTFREGVEEEFFSKVMAVVDWDPAKITGPLSPGVSDYLVERALREGDGAAARTLLDRTPPSGIPGASIAKLIREAETSALLGAFDAAVNQLQGLLSYNSSTSLYRTHVVETLRRVWIHAITNVYKSGFVDTPLDTETALHDLDRVVNLWDSMPDLEPTDADGYRIAASRAMLAVRDRQPSRVDTLRRALQQTMDRQMSIASYPTTAGLLAALIQLRSDVPREAGLSFVEHIACTSHPELRIMLVFNSSSNRSIAWPEAQDARARFVRTYETALIEVAVPSKQPQYVVAHLSENSSFGVLNAGLSSLRPKCFLVDDTGSFAVEIPEFPGERPEVSSLPPAV